MLAYKNRFHGHGSLRYVYSNGTSVRTQKITVKFAQNPRRQDSRFAVVVSKKVLKRSWAKSYSPAVYQKLFVMNYQKLMALLML